MKKIMMGLLLVATALRHRYQQQKDSAHAEWTCASQVQHDLRASADGVEGLLYALRHGPMPHEGNAVCPRARKRSRSRR